MSSPMTDEELAAYALADDKPVTEEPVVEPEPDVEPEPTETPEPEPEPTPAPDDDEGIPEKFRGKSRREIAEAYTHVERVLGLPPDLRAGGLAALGFETEAPKEPEPEAKEPEIDPEMQELLPLYLTEYDKVTQQEKRALKRMGYSDEEVAAQLKESEAERAELASASAQAQANYFKGQVDQRIGTTVEPLYAELGETFISKDVDAVLAANPPVKGITADEVKAEIGKLGISAREWRETDANVKANLIYNGARLLAYNKFAAAPDPPPPPEPEIEPQAPVPVGTGGAGSTKAVVSAAVKQAAHDLMGQVNGLTEQEAIDTILDSQKKAR